MDPLNHTGCTDPQAAVDRAFISHRGRRFGDRMLQRRKARGRHERCLVERHSEPITQPAFQPGGGLLAFGRNRWT